jgi:hypothetical protein
MCIYHVHRLLYTLTLGMDSGKTLSCVKSCSEHLSENKPDHVALPYRNEVKLPDNSASTHRTWLVSPEAWNGKWISVGIIHNDNNKTNLKS